MAGEHAELYEQAMAARPPRAQGGRGDPSPRAQPLRFLDRPVRGTPLVSVLIPHFNQARFLAECVESVRAQSYPEVETIVIDDASTEADAREAVEQLEHADDVTVLRMHENGGPSRARNAGLERCRGRYVLPVDADNVLLPDAVERLVDQLSEAGEEIGFIYPNIQYFGNREDYYEVPEYNLYTLLHGNFCDTCSLLDRQIFDAGERYAEGIRLGHEDWEFALRLAARGVRGEVARGPTLRYRKWGFNRSDVVDHSPEQFEELLAEISPFRGREAEIKARESPALSIVPLARIEADAERGQTLATGLRAQACADIELIARYDGVWPGEGGLPVVQRIPAALANGAFDALHQGLELARGAFVAVSAGDAAGLLADRAFAARVLRRFAVEPGLGAIVLAATAAGERFPFQPLDADAADLTAAVPHTVIWRRTEEQHMPHGLHADPGDPVPSLARQLSAAGSTVEWRWWPADEGEVASPAGWWRQLPASRAVAEDPHALRPGAQPLLPGSDSYRVPRWEEIPTWVPPLSALAIRHRERDGERRIVTSGPQPTGYEPEHHLGALRSTSLPGTARLVRIGDRYRAEPLGGWEKLPADAEQIGYVETAALPGLDTIALAVHRATRQPLLVTLPEDPLLGEVDVIETLGCLDPFPLRPREVPLTQRADGLLGLTKAIDLRQRRHRYAIGAVPEGELLGELGGLAGSHLGGQIPAWIVDGRLHTDRHRPPRRWFGATSAARWVAEPAAWRGLAPRSTQAKAVLRRAAMAAAGAARRERPTPAPEGEPAGWLFELSRPGLTPLFAAYHPVNGDQLLCRSSEEAAQLGYLAPALLGHLRLVAPQTGKLDQDQAPIPWARRFGAVPRSW
jgi:hypothetical protein